MGEHNSSQHSKSETGLLSSKSPVLKQGWFWILLVVAISEAIAICILALGKANNNIQTLEDGSTIEGFHEAVSEEDGEVYTTLKDIDVNGMTVNEACSVARKAGWTIRYVVSGKDYVTKTDCSDTNHKIIDVNYGKKKYYEFNGKRELQNDYEQIILIYGE